VLVNADSLSAKDRIVALTGGTGFIGGSVLRQLLRAGWRVRVLVRDSASLSALPFSSAVHCISGSLEDPHSLNQLVHGAYAVVHCAGTVRGITQAHFDQANVDGVVRLVRAASSQEVPPRFLALSSLAAREPHLSPYAASKWQGECALAAGADAMTWTVLRPPPVYGPGDRELLPLFRWMGRGFAPLAGSQEARFSLLYVEDLAAAILQWLCHPSSVMGLFELHDGHPGGYTWQDVIDTVANLRSRQIWSIPLPIASLRLLAKLNVAAARLGRYAPMLTPGKVRELNHPDWVCDNAPLNHAIGWKPQITLEEGLHRTFGWRTQLTPRIDFNR